MKMQHLFTLLTIGNRIIETAQRCIGCALVFEDIVCTHVTLPYNTDSFQLVRFKFVIS